MQKRLHIVASIAVKTTALIKTARMPRLEILPMISFKFSHIIDTKSIRLSEAVLMQSSMNILDRHIRRLSDLQASFSVEGCLPAVRGCREPRSYW